MNARPTWCFDFDGTLVDYSDAARYANEFAAASLGGTGLPDYWEQRRAGVSERVLAQRSGVPARAFARYEAIRRQVIAEDGDTTGWPVLPGALALLQRLVEEVNVWIVSHRPCAVQLLRQAQRCGIAPFVTEYHCTAGGSAVGRGPRAVAAAKAAVLRRAPGPVVMVGDSNTDVLAARQAGAFSVAVPTGCTSEARLRHVRPTFLCANLDELLRHVQADGWRGRRPLARHAKNADVGDIVTRPSTANQLYGDGCLDPAVDGAYAPPAVV
jgi:phosphoglycolate phosphatase-like HAD superfamily hydrolase